jgi:ABC-2 type transport system permease protein
VEVRGLLRELADDGAAVFMSSHLVAEVGQLADRIGIIHQGRLVTEMSRTHLDQADAGRRLAVGFRNPAQAERARAALTAWGLDCRADLRHRPAGDPGTRLPPADRTAASYRGRSPRPASRCRVNGFTAAVAAESLKARRSSVPAMTMLAVTLAAAVAGLFMFILANPARAKNFGLLNQKANLSGFTADWTGLLQFLAQIVAVADLMLFAFILTWIFGREAADGTQRYLLALPVSRSTIVAAKFTVATAWAALTNLWLIAVTLGIGKILDLPGGSVPTLRHGIGVSVLAAGLMLLVVPPIAVIASAGRGYLAPLSCALAAVVLAQIAAALGWAALFPWAVPAVAAGLAPQTTLGAPSLALAAVTAVTGVAGTVLWWRSGRADA